MKQTETKKQKEGRKIMELQGKKIAFLGDSITEGHGVENPENIFWRRIEKSTGAKCYGYGIGGTRIAMQHTPSENPLYDFYFASRVDRMIPDADIVVIFGGTNDFGHGDAEFGKDSDRTEETFCSAYHLLLEKVIKRYPKAQIVTMTPLHRDSEKCTGINAHNLYKEFPLETYVDAIISISGYYGIPVLDLFRTSGLQPAVPILKKKYMPDGLHPNDAGHERLAGRLQGFLQSL